MGSKELQAELEQLRAKRRPALSEEQQRAKAQEEELRAALAEERRALRAEENEAIIAAHAPTRTRRFFDFDPDGVQPDTVEHERVTCRLYTRFVVRGANADQLERHGDAVTISFGADGKPKGSVDTAKQVAVSNEIAAACVVYPTAEIVGVSPEQHGKNIRASLWYLGAARAEIGAAAIALGGVDAAAHRSKS